MARWASGGFLQCSCESQTFEVNQASTPLEMGTFGTQHEDFILCSCRICGIVTMLQGSLHKDEYEVRESKYKIRRRTQEEIDRIRDNRASQFNDKENDCDCEDLIEEYCGDCDEPGRLGCDGNGGCQDAHMELIYVGFWKGKEQIKTRKKFRPNLDRFLKCLDKAEREADIHKVNDKTKCKICNQYLSMDKYTLYGYHWPGWLKHYIEHHNVILPKGFVEMLKELRDEG